MRSMSHYVAISRDIFSTYLYLDNVIDEYGSAEVIADADKSKRRIVIANRIRARHLSRLEALDKGIRRHYPGHPGDDKFHGPHYLCVAWVDELLIEHLG